MEGGTRAAAAVELVYYTDPLCCWSWAQEPQWRLLLYAFAGRLAWRYRMGGMISGWDRYDDPVNAVHRPAQMGPVWMQAQHTSGMPIDTESGSTRSACHCSMSRPHGAAGDLVGGAR